jgi:hypothetical protein
MQEAGMVHDARIPGPELASDGTPLIVVRISSVIGTSSPTPLPTNRPILTSAFVNVPDRPTVNVWAASKRAATMVLLEAGVPSQNWSRLESAAVAHWQANRHATNAANVSSAILHVKRQLLLIASSLT